MLDSKTIKQDFPIFTNQPSLVYLDSAATSLKPQVVINAEREYLEHYSTNVGRGLYPLAETATEKFETVRAKVAHFIGAKSEKEIVFTSGTTDSLNLAAELLGSSIQPGDNVITTTLEHHSNFLPWKELSLHTESEFRIAPIDTDGSINVQALLDLIDEHTTLVAFSAVSNVTGTISPVTDIIKLVRKKNPKVITIVDAAQALSHMLIDVSLWDADFIAFSGHKCFGPTGVGVLYGKQSLLETLAPVSYGGGMVLDACAGKTVYKDIPHRFEAGTPNIGGIITLGAALDYTESIGIENIHIHEISLVRYASEKLQESFGDTIRIIGPKDPASRSSILSFVLDGLHPHDIAHILGESGICVRAGEHCAAPLHRSLGLGATTRLSFSIYNSKEDIDTFIERLKEIQEIFNK